MFCDLINELVSPPSIKVLAMAIKRVTVPIKPKSSGVRSFARKIFVAKEIPFTTKLSKKVQKSPEIVLLLKDFSITKNVYYG